MEHTLAGERQQRTAEFIEPFRAKPTLGKDFDPSFKAGVRKRQEGVAPFEAGVGLLAEYRASRAAQREALLEVRRELGIQAPEGAVPDAFERDQVAVSTAANDGRDEHGRERRPGRARRGRAGGAWADGSTPEWGSR
jgi:hypothetical protein